jgi:hypothetical protein
MWTVSSGDGPDEEFFRRMSAPENEIPVAVPLTTLLARTEDVAVALVGLRVYSTGLTFDLALRVRPAAVSRFQPRGTWPPHGFWHEGLLVGVELSDGRRLSTADEQWPPAPGRDAALTMAAGSGGDTTYDQTYWLHPLPPEGPLQIVVRGDELGIPETATELDGAAIRRAAGQVVELWPWAPPPHDEPVPPAAPEVPPDSWFAR